MQKSILWDYITARETLLDASSLAAWEKELSAQLGVKPYAAPKEGPLGLISKLKRLLIARAFFVHLHTLPFIVICGPDGVGKTTLLQNILKIFACLPLNTAHFHHTDLAKAKETKAANDLVKEEDISFWRKLRRRYTPAIIKKIYGTFSGELKYALRINAEIYRNFYAGKLSLSDRYIYDRAVKMQMLPGKIKSAKIATSLNAYLMRRPYHVIVPTDTPAAIHARKQELTPDEITRYYADLKLAFKRCGLKQTDYIEVGGKTPEDLALEAAEIILERLSPLIFRYIGSFEKALKRS